MNDELPLFPLGLVLFPRGALPLRIFEPRYVDMVGRCLREGSPFGVVTIREGREVGAAARFHAVGTSARIVDFDALPDGLLGIACRGERRLRVLSYRVRPDQLVVGMVEWLPEVSPQPVPAPYHALPDLLRRVLASDAAQAYAAQLTPDWDDAGWVCDRLAELLPLPVELRLALLELDDQQQRLDLLYAVLQEQRLG